ncbi:uncharacterized protein MELLADRAFT_64659 [Melampsora larici-populina 98AG31]|uniref:Uncharacterized protein n=1 Tax=Melampsora larici-populina (strain 98AG31 / pathotype 3-4-7) TaxID=747676 RepID=F4RSA5_MELLP|nr:uncharacterized protein MELLADRAFT_64659 [Melampsora larici-populina 98AG31]EGG04563.1 hypothetical protein MELLADRAFT_64659 [Melampsora larici-populina 98AG31]
MVVYIVLESSSNAFKRTPFQLYGRWSYIKKSRDLEWLCEPRLYLRQWFKTISTDARGAHGHNSVWYHWNKQRAGSLVEGDQKIEYHADATLRKKPSAAPIDTSLDPASSDTTTSSIRNKRPSWVPGTSFFEETGLVRESSGYPEQGSLHQISNKDVALTKGRNMSLIKPDLDDAVPGAKSSQHQTDKIIPIIPFLKEEKENRVVDQKCRSIKGENQEDKVHADNQGPKLNQVPDLTNATAAVNPHKKKKCISKLSKGKWGSTSKKSNQSETGTDNEKIVAEKSSESLKVDQHNDTQQESMNPHQTKTDHDKFGDHTGSFAKESGNNKLQEQNQNPNQTESNTIKTHIKEEINSQQQHKTPKLTTPNQKTRPLRRVFEQGTIDKGGKKFLARIESSSSGENPELKLENNSQKASVGGKPGVKSGNDSQKGCKKDILDEKSAVKAETNPGKETLQGISSAQVETSSKQENIHGSYIFKDKAPSMEEVLSQAIKEMSPKQDTIMEHTTSKEQTSDKEENIQTKKLMQGDKEDLHNPSKNPNQEGLYEFPSIASKDQTFQGKSVDKPNDNHHIVTQLGEAQ